jgi:hypothetical protein
MHDAAKIVEGFLRLLMIPDPDAARRYCDGDVEIRFIGNRLIRDEWLLVRAGLAKP